MMKMLDERVLPLICEKFGDASMIVLAGSQGRALRTNNTNETLDTSDFDFIILYDKLPEKYPCALFSSLIIDFKDGNGPTNIDLKIIDRDYWEELKKVTRQFRRFPFLFSMMSEGHVIRDNDGIYPQYQQEALEFLGNGPDGLSKSELLGALSLIDAFERELDKTCNKRNPMAIAFEAQFVIGNLILNLHDQWEALTERIVNISEESIPEENAKFQHALKALVSGDQAPIREYLSEVRQKINERSESGLAPDAYIPSYDTNDIDPSLKSRSERAFFTIMLGQYAERFRTGMSRGPSRYQSLKSATWLTSKKLVAYKEGRPFQFGEAFISQCTPEHQQWLEKVKNALQQDNHELLERTVKSFLEDWGGKHTGEEERYYVEDQARRRRVAALHL